MRSLAVSFVVAAALSTGLAALADKPKLTLKANPVMAYSPAHIVFTADLTGGANDDQGLYCLGVEWEWGDGTKSEDSADCDPFEAGKSEIKRRFVNDHTYHIEEPQPFGAGAPDYRDFRVQLRLRKSGKVILSGGTTVKVHPEATPLTAPSRVPED
jgi:hypothetical protein